MHLLKKLAAFASTAALATIAAVTVTVAPAAAEPGPGQWQIRPQHSDLCLDVVGNSFANGAEVNQWLCHGVTWLHQMWEFRTIAVTSGTTYYEIRVQSTGKCLDVTGGTGATGNTVPIQMYTCLGGQQTNQHWAVRYPEGRTDIFQLVARHSRKCLDVIGGPGNMGRGVRLQQHDCWGMGQTNQFFYLHRGY